MEDKTIIIITGIKFQMELSSEFYHLCCFTLVDKESLMIDTFHIKAY